MRFPKRQIKRLSDEYRGALEHMARIGHGALSDDEIWSVAKRAIPREYKNVHDLIQEFQKAPPNEKGELFRQLCKTLDEIAPKGCHFSERYGIWGFWEEDVY